MARYFIDGGQFMYIILLLDIALLVLAVVSIFVNSLNLRIVSLASATLPSLLGYLGYHIGMTEAYSAVVNADPEIQLELLELSREVAKIPLVFGGVSTIVLVVMIAPRFIWSFAHKIEKLSNV